MLSDIFSIKIFSDDISTYLMLKSFWNETIAAISGSEGEAYVHNHYANGIEVMDGNPIYTSLLPNGKGLRIIQIEEDPDEPIFTAWTNKLMISCTEIEELVISLQLNPDTFQDALRLIELFVADALSLTVIQDMNQKFDSTGNNLH
jgi:hypothetical protein